MVSSELVAPANRAARLAVVSHQRCRRLPAWIRWQRLFIVALPVALLAGWMGTIGAVLEGPARWWALLAVAVGLSVGLAVRAVPRRRPHLVPRELPSPPRIFVGRREELAGLTGHLIRPARSAPRVALVAGDPGVGKTTLTLEAAHVVAGQFPDGQLYARFDPFEEDWLDRVMAHFVAALQGRGEPVPDGPAAVRERYRSLLAGKRVLIVVDDVRRVNDILELLPPPGRGNALLASSRHSWRGALPDGCYRLILPPLPDDDGLTLLRRMVGPDRIDSEPPAAYEIVHAAGGQPLALRVAAVALRYRPHTSLARAAERIRGGSGRGAPVPDASLEAVLPLLGEQERAALKLLGMLEGQVLTPWRLAALLGDRPPGEWSAAEADERDRAAVRILDRLVLAGLVERTRQDAAGVSRFRVLDHVQDYATRLVKDESAQWRARYGERLARAADVRHRSGPSIARGQVYQLFERGQLRQAVSAARWALALAQEQRDTRSEALGYAALAELHAELGGVEDVRDLAQTSIRRTGERAGEPALPRALRCWAMTHRRLRQIPAAAELLGRAGQAAEHAGDVAEQVRVRRELAIAYSLGAEPERGWTPVEQAELLLARHGAAGKLRPHVLAARAAVGKGVARSLLGQDPNRAAAELALAERRLVEAIELAGAHDLHLLVAWMQHLRGQVALLGGHHGIARARARQALSQFLTMRHRYGVAHCRMLLGQVFLADDRPDRAQLDQARLALEEALEGFRTCGDRWVDAEASRLLAQVHVRAGDRAGEAVALLVGAQRGFFSIGDRSGWEAARDELDTLSSPLRRPFLQAELEPDPAMELTVPVGGAGGHR
jgi:hypothetical protein